MQNCQSRIIIVCLFFALGFPRGAFSRTLEVGPGKEFANLNAAAEAVQSGDTIVFATGVHAGGAYVIALAGNEEKWITIRGDGAMGSIIRGGSFAFQLSDPSYVRIEGLVFEEQTGNGVNIDDGGTYDTPAHHLIIDRCEWRSIAASGNNDMLKMSGVDNFYVTNCSFSNGAEGGSLIDMVGCHLGEFSDNTFQNAGSNCIQAKGGTALILVQRNKFFKGGQRAINIGGSTGLEYFRPLGTDYEAQYIRVWSNLFEGGVAPIAFVGAINSLVINNTIIRPERWAIRILQESVEGFQPCGNNSFVNNIVVFNSTQPAINIGPNTAPESFTFSNNLWYNPDNASWSGPNTTVTEPGRILNQDPQFADLEYRLSPTSPAIGAGLKTIEPVFDLYHNVYSDPRSIGAVEFGSASVLSPIANSSAIRLFPNPTSDFLHIQVEESSTIRIVDLLGRTLWSDYGSQQYEVDATGWAPGCYLLIAGERISTLLKR